MNIQEMTAVTEELAILIRDFRLHLIGLNRTGRSFSLEEAREEAAGYFTANRVVFGLHVGKSLIGFSVIKQDEGTWWLDWLYVAPAHRGYTNASLLFDAAEAFALGQGADQLYVWIHPDNTPMIRFLAKKGYNVLNLIELKKQKKTVTTTVDIMGNSYRY